MAAVSFMDWEVGRVLSGLDALGLAQDTAVLFHAVRSPPEFDRIVAARAEVTHTLLRSGPRLEAGRCASSIAILRHLYPLASSLGCSLEVDCLVGRARLVDEVHQLGDRRADPLHCTRAVDRRQRRSEDSRHRRGRRRELSLSLSLSLSLCL